MANQPSTTRPPNTYEIKLIEKYAESFAGQSDLMDKLAQQLLAVKLAIPGLYATVLKLAAGDNATLSISALLYVAFGLWLAALVLTLLALMPRKWNVNTEIMQQDPRSTTGELGIKDFFVRSARRKRKLLIGATLLFFFGTAFAAFTVF